ILPVRRMQHHFPDVVPARSGTPCGLLCGYSLDGLLKVWSMPGLFLIGFVQQGENELCGIHGASSGAIRSESRKDVALSLLCQRPALLLGRQNLANDIGLS